MLKTPPHVQPVTQRMSIPQVARAARRNLLEIIPGVAYVQPMISGRTVARWHMLQDPTGLKQVLLDRIDIYPKSMVTKRMLRPAVGDSLFIAEGAHWRWQRRAAAPVFQHRHLMAMTPYMTDAARRTVDRLNEARGQAVDLHHEMVTATFDVICDVSLSGREAVDREAVGGAVNRYFDTIGRMSLLDVLSMPEWIPRPAELVSRQGTVEMRAMTDRIIAERAKSPKREDLLGLMMDAEDNQTGRRMTAEELRDNLLAFLVAGHETTALALSWALYLIALDERVQDRLIAEARQALNGDLASGDHLGQLGYTRQVIEEAMRLYPPGGILSRTATEPDILCGREVRPGDTIVLPIYALHRHEMWWDAPHQFDPGNFAPEKAKARNRYLYLPFGAGPRVCIGLNFALIEAQIILASLMARYRFERVEGRAPVPVQRMSLRPEGGIWLRPVAH